MTKLKAANLIICSMGFGRVRHNRIVQSPQRMLATQKKVRSREDDNYSNWAIINYRVYKGLYHISCLLQINKTIRPPQGLLFLVLKIL